MIGATAAERSDMPPISCASELVGAGLTACCGNGPIRARRCGRKHGQELLRRKLLCGFQWRAADHPPPRRQGSAGFFSEIGTGEGQYFTRS